MATVLDIPRDVETYDVKYGQKTLTLTSLKKVFWPQLNKTKRDLLFYYTAVSGVLLPHVKDRGLLLRKYPDGVEGKLVTVNRLPGYHPEWLQTCTLMRTPEGMLDLPMAQDIASLLWIANLGCIDLWQWPVRCDDMDRPDYILFDLDPIPPAMFPQAREAALLVRHFLQKKSVNIYAKTSGFRGIHLYVPIHRKPYGRETWRVARQVSYQVAKEHPNLLTSEHIIRKRLPGRVLVNCNPNAPGRTLPCAYSLCPHPEATVSAPVSWEELEAGVDVSELTIDSVPSRIERIGDLLKPLLRPESRCPLEALL
jgi:bifunctional non-homologous end joining protein LigD